jgi:hypothetical protein
MADLDSALRQRAREIADVEARQSAEQRQAAAAQVMHEAGRLLKLAANEEVTWFLETYMRPIVEAERAAALDIQRSAAERDHAAQRFDLGNALLHLLAVQAEAARARAAQAAGAAGNQRMDEKML